MKLLHTEIVVHVCDLELKPGTDLVYICTESAFAFLCVFFISCKLPEDIINKGFVTRIHYPIINLFNTHSGKDKTETPFPELRLHERPFDVHF